ncbi:alpha/beta fold hydrolase [Micromonospora sp. DT233]|uniref:alpha/beta fold hydrolase n=1 Tax=Micromonospora sp. DT233 TaxID=3393432 RepID=UPI003CFB7B0E
MALFAGFEAFDRQVNGTTIHGVVGGNGPPLLLLHGYPQTHAMWHRVAPRLARENTVICTDLRGYGDSPAPAPHAGHVAYSKREMARDQLEVMAALGHRRFAVVGHDRGGRVARRMALDHPAAVTGLAVLDIVPTRLVYGVLDQARATAAWRYFFLVQPGGLPERLIGADPHRYLDHTLDEWRGDGNALDPAAVAEYHRCFDPDTVRASCADYRAGATVDLATTRPTPAGASPARCWSCGASAASARRTTCRRVGRRRRTAWRVARWTAGTSSPRNARTRRRPHCRRSCPRTDPRRRGAAAGHRGWGGRLPIPPTADRGVTERARRRGVRVGGYLFGAIWS